MPAADIEVTGALVRKLLLEQHPDLAGMPLSPEANGWDNVIYRLGEQLAVRVPRREAAAHLIHHEQRWLPVLAAGLGVATPVPVRCGTPSPLFPWYWSVVRWIPGTTAAAVPAAGRRGAANELGTFVGALGRPAPPDAPHNPFRGVPLAARGESVRQRLAGGLVPRPARAGALWAELSALPEWSGPARWLHGDLHPGNLILDRGRLAGVIDFGDLCAGDPAVDLAAAWTVFDAAGRRGFTAALDGCGVRPDEDSWQRGRGWALVLATALLDGSDDHPGFRRLGEEILARVLGP